jgi:Ca-activated chloride channel family protein
MRLKLNDEKLTAYVLGELDAAECEAVEKALEGNEAAQRAVAELRGVAKLAEAVFECQPVDALTEAQRAAIISRAKEAQQGEAQAVPGTFSKRPKAAPRRWIWTTVRVAAVITVVGAIAAALGVPNLLRSRMQSSDRHVSSAAEQARQLAQRLPEEQKRNLERFMIRDINGPAASVVGMLDKADFENPNVQRAVAAASQQKWDEAVRYITQVEPPPAPSPQQSRWEQALNDPNQVYWPGHNTEAYDHVVDNAFLDVVQNSLSTFSIDVDTASYSNVRRFLNLQTLPPKDAVRIEEMINYFDYDYAPPSGEDPFAAHIEAAGCPWAPEHRLVRVGLKGKVLAAEERPTTNLVFLLDVSGSMTPENKLPLLRQAMKLLANQLGEKDKVAIVVYAGASGLVLPSTGGDNRETILDAVDRLQAGGSTNGGEGIQLAYKTAIENFVKGGVNRVILATDGDFNVGVTNQGDLVRTIEEKAKTGVFLTVLGFGMGNVKDASLEKLADKGNGNYAYIDTLKEAQKVLVDQMQGTLVTIAKDVKIQVEFNPAQVKAYRLIGYENRMLAKEDFNDDTKDAGEIGAGHTVTALYELVPAGGAIATPGVDPLKYQRTPVLADKATDGELLTLKMRYKQPDGDVSKLLEFPVTDAGKPYAEASPDFKFASAVAGFGMLLRDSPYKGNLSFDAVLELAQEGKGADRNGFRNEFVDLVKTAKILSAPSMPLDAPGE